MRRWWLTLAVAGSLAAGAALADDTAATGQRFTGLRGDLTQLRAFLYRMPKGGDLHNHLSGAVYAERYVTWAAADGLCLQRQGMKIVQPPCSEAQPAVAAALSDQSLYDRLVNALSMRNFHESPEVASGHDQFFSTFARISGAARRRAPDMIAEVARRNAAQNVQYLELMVSFNPPALGELARRLGPEAADPARFAAALATLKAEGLDRLVPGEIADLDADERDLRRLLGCDGPAPDPGCGVTIRYIAQVSRNSAPAAVFAQTALAAAMVRADSRVVGLNFVQPEDYQVARRDYSLHMRMIAELAGREVPVALHAGELWLGLVPPEDLRFHIREAVEVAGARRIGHGVDLAFEYDMDGLLAAMRAKGVAVEINLTSNDVILGVRGRDHPLLTYRHAGVATVLSTDDEGVSRIDLTNEYFRAARDYNLDYPALKQIARNAIAFSFLNPGDKAVEGRRLEASFRAFERDMARRR